MNFDTLAVIIAIVSIILLIILGTLLYFMKVKKKKFRMNGKRSRKNSISIKELKDIKRSKDKKNASDIKEVKEGKEPFEHLKTSYASSEDVSGNHRLDGAKVSHRREHPDRLAQEVYYKEIKTQEEEKRLRKIEFERKHKLQLVYSPCSGDIISVAQSIEESKESGLYNPGVIIKLTEDKIASPVNGVIKEISEENHQITFESNNGMVVVLKTEPSACDSSSDYWTQIANHSKNVSVGDVLIRVNKSIIRDEINPFTVSLIVDNYKNNQLILTTRENYVSIGDKLLTLKESPF